LPSKKLTAADRLYIAGLEDYYVLGKVNIGQKLVNLLDCCPKEAVIIGDTIHDYKVARKSVTDCILLETGHHNRDKLSACPIKIAEYPAQLAELLGL
jgi:phosphoglycolate phosphatase